MPPEHADSINCIAIELSPVYCQIEIDRWEAFTGRKATKVGRKKVH